MFHLTKISKVILLYYINQSMRWGIVNASVRVSEWVSEWDLWETVWMWVCESECVSLQYISTTHMSLNLHIKLLNHINQPLGWGSVNASVCERVSQWVVSECVRDCHYTTHISLNLYMYQITLLYQSINVVRDCECECESEWVGRVRDCMNVSEGGGKYPVNCVQFTIS